MMTEMHMMNLMTVMTMLNLMTVMTMMNLMTVVTMKSTTKVAGVYPAHTQWRELALIGPWRPPPCSQNVIAPLAKPKEVTLHTPLLGTVLRPRIFKNIV